LKIFLEVVSKSGIKPKSELGGPEPTGKSGVCTDFNGKVMENLKGWVSSVNVFLEIWRKRRSRRRRVDPARRRRKEKNKETNALGGPGGVLSVGTEKGERTAGQASRK